MRTRSPHVVPPAPRRTVERRVRRLVAGLVPAVAALLFATLVTAPAQAESPRRERSDRWEEVPGAEAEWFTASAAAGGQTWHVGLRRVWDGGESELRGAVAHCTKTGCEETFPDDLLGLPPGESHALRDVEPSGRDSAWAVGYVGARPLVAHWDGETWSNAQPNWASTLHGVSVVSPSEVWVAGDLAHAPAVLRWDGSTWQRVPVGRIRGCGSGGRMVAIAADGPVVVGVVECTAGGTRLVEQRRDGSWVVRAVDGISERVRVEDVLWSGRDLWAVGSTAAPGDDAVVLRREGRRWTAVPVPLTGELVTLGLGPRRLVWAGGEADNGVASVARWDGSTWQSVDAAGLGGVEITTIAARGRSTVEVAGQKFGDGLVWRLG